jgi:hypothetical protein
MLLELAVIPEVFDESAYGNPASCNFCLKVLMPILLEEAVVRDMRDGSWGRWMRKPPMKCHRATVEIIETLAKRQRLNLFPPALATEPTDSSEWCYEALATHEKVELDAIVCANSVASEYPGDKLIHSLEALPDSDWYKNRACSLRLKRQSAEYLQNLASPLNRCNSAMFIDPHLDPSRKGYRDFHKLLNIAHRRQAAPIIELHRCSYEGGGENRRMLTLTNVESMFESLAAALYDANLKAEVFVWDIMHDRYLITNQIGIALLNGFDISQDVTELTTWTRLSAKDREDIQREFDPSSRRHQLKYRFEIGRRT